MLSKLDEKEWALLEKMAQAITDKENQQNLSQ